VGGICDELFELGDVNGTAHAQRVDLHRCRPGVADQNVLDRSDLAMAAAAEFSAESDPADVHTRYGRRYRHFLGSSSTYDRLDIEYGFAIIA
jgi:hypothetical protein